MSALSEREEIEQLGDIIASVACKLVCHNSICLANLKSELWLSSLKLARIAALSFCTTALSSAIVLADLTLRMNCLTTLLIS